jgi:hypothetical protein
MYYWLQNRKMELADLWDRFRPREWRPIIKHWLWDRKMGQRKSETEMWQWADVSVNGVWGKRIKVFSRPRNWQQMLVCLELAESNSDASRLLKTGSFEMRDWCLDKSWEKVTLNTPLPDSPTHLRRGKKLYGIKTVWLPPAGISEKQGEEMLREYALKI